ncbi:MAG TPA: acetyl-CoA carboxylase biotin carboxyl carrier protein [Bacteroidota bacterium]|nr:acetyl-CoA carboxylase biotin carboxyl carrier protein [Bacteroidota bacterium]
MDLALLKKLVRIVERSGVEEIEIEEEGLRIRVAKNSHNNSTPPAVAAAQRDQAPAPAAETAASPAPPEAKLHEIKSPIVGTFYRAPAPDADPYVEVGQTVQPKTVLCIIEAMKLMNEIESDAAGRITKILVENGQPVEYNQPLFLIEPV